MRRLSLWQVMRADRLLFWAPVVAMIAIAGNQHYLARSKQLSPWDGGGFGMFSTCDFAEARALRVGVLLSDGVRHPAEISYEPRNVRKLLAMPTLERTKALAVELAKLRWEASDFDPLAVVPGGTGAGSSIVYRAVKAWAPSRSPQGGGVLPEKVMVEVVRCRFDASTGTVAVISMVQAEQRWTGP